MQSRVVLFTFILFFKQVLDMVDVSNVLVDNGCISMQMQSCRGRGPGGMLAYMGGFVWVRWEPHKRKAVCGGTGL